MTLKQKLSWFVPILPIALYCVREEGPKEVVKGIFNLVYSLALFTSLTMYTLLGLQFKTFNVKEQLEMWEQEDQERKAKETLQGRLFNYADKNKDGMIEVSEFNDFCEKTKNSDLSNKVLIDYYNIEHNIWESVDLEKAIESYEQ